MNSMKRIIPRGTYTKCIQYELPLFEQSINLQIEPETLDNRLEGKETFKEIPVQFVGKGEYRGFNFRQILITDWAYCYEMNVGGQIYYRVFKKVENRQYMTISLPWINAFGIWAWDFRDWNKAKHKFNELNESRK